MASNSLDLMQRSSPMGPPKHPASKAYDNHAHLMSPPDHVQDSFNQNHYESGKASSSKSDSDKQPMPMSPPISPYSQPVSTAEAPTGPSNVIKDPVLYPADETPSSPAQQPLFAIADVEEDHNSIIEGHIRARSQSPATFAMVAPPNREDYGLALCFKSQVMKHFKQNPRGWLRQERRYLQDQQAARNAQGNRLPKIMPAKPTKTHRQRGDRIQKPQSTPRPIRTHPPVGPSPGAGHVRPARRVSATPEPSRRAVAPNREDKDFAKLDDYCPPLDSLPNKPNSLKVEWKGQPLDLSNDPNKIHLHPDEVSLASSLRLDAATYLTSKRRIFIQRRECCKSGKEFRKTDAQQACKIDVNKASKLWTAFEKVGWLNKKWMEPHLNKNNVDLTMHIV
ncbi:swirm domain-containing [Fusarium longipes]|uniref:Swirm domain-containing n=1 Tax=Fusarium longipes TaxID=694270 RepID=A0A395RN04_9HYPO|nr:swirm domain-containing [Fusarium longipes]